MVVFFCWHVKEEQSHHTFLLYLSIQLLLENYMKSYRDRRGEEVCFIVCIGKFEAEYPLSKPLVKGCA